ncbi:thiamine pyrophosphate-dependent enzyme [Enterococcus quebecensis]|uniref:Thiamine pyrophosphate enzyme TPP-binding domain-containing protein n=1 Tax=Enterococcus quebecensis TaxID=903983 RepID=A0A1E5GUK4_9ENTE|nr:thiamine pyrophosphate-dependent enzyme [Enterococcus quebecensis]OEG16348.1 hypothetical protein BCR23_05520 [Enterococcus quebecensis]
MEKETILAKLLTKYPDALIVSSNGYVTRDLYNFKDRIENFYLVGSMGMAAPIALGLALSLPEKMIIILDGDGSFLMNYGITTMIGFFEPKNLLHVVLDNGVHESTGGQKTIGLMNQVEATKSLGYRSGFIVEHSIAQWPEQLLLPAFIHCKIKQRTEGVGNRVVHTPQEIVARFSKTIK